MKLTFMLLVFILVVTDAIPALAGVILALTAFALIED